MKKYKLGDLLTIKNGCDHKKLKDGKYPVYGSGGIMRYVDSYLYDKESVLLPRKGTLSNIQYACEPFWTVDTIYYTELKSDLVNAYYLYRYLSLLDLSGLDSGTGVPSMTFDAYYNISVSLPPLPTQQKIAAVLSSLDKKIALNSRINARLEQMAKRLYEHYFVQFDFPTADGKPYKTSGGKMVYSSELKREIPDGWEVKRLGELGNLKNGINYEKSEIGDKIYKIVNVRNISASTIFISESDLDELNLKSKNADNYLISKNDILIARSGTPGATRLLARKSENIIFCGFIICFSVKDAELKYYLFFCLKQLEFVTKKQSGGSILSNISQDVLKNLRVIIPSKEVLEDFNQKTLSIFNYQLSIQEESARLTSLRDRLLPLLMNGQVSV